MKTILFIGQEPDTVDFSDPALPPGIDAAKIHAGIALGMQSMRDRGWQPELLLVPPDDGARVALEKKLDGANFDCVVIGGGIRLPPASLPLFETLLNTVHRHAPRSAIAFNTRPEDTADAAARGLRGG